MLTVLLGGARSGKSAAAERLAGRFGGTVAFVATAPRLPGDDDLSDRIERHRVERPAGWITIEEQLDLADALERAGGADVVVVDCLTTWIGNLVHHGRSDDEARAAARRALDVARHRSGDTIVVTNEVGLGIVPDNALARRYRDLLGRVNRDWVDAADRSFFLVAGRALPLHELAEL